MRKHAILLFLIATVLQFPAFGTQMEKEFKAVIEKTVELRYLLFLPEEYSQNDDKKWPLILFLHGAGERGADVSRVATHGPPKLVASNPDFPFILVSPQCPAGEYWDPEALHALLNKIRDEYRVDDTRLYLTGLSMGGFGTWHMASAYPDLFAAIAPICGGGEVFKARTLVHLPVWVFHGTADNIVPFHRSEEMVKALEKLGGNVRFTRYEGVGHDSWTPTYANPELYEWFLSHRKPDSGAQPQQ